MPPSWLATLNDRVFFWLHPKRLATLVRSRPNRGAEHNVLIIDTASLVAVHHDRIRLSAINSGATQWPSAPPRGTQTFQTIEDYPFTERRRGRTLDNAVAELTVIGGVTDIAAYVVAVQRVVVAVQRVSAPENRDGGLRARSPETAGRSPQGVTIMTPASTAPLSPDTGIPRST